MGEGRGGDAHKCASTPGAEGCIAQYRGYVRVYLTVALLFPLFISRGFQFTLFIALRDRPSRPVASASHRDFVKAHQPSTPPSARARARTYIYTNARARVQKHMGAHQTRRAFRNRRHRHTLVYMISFFAGADQRDEPPVGERVDVTKPFKNARHKNLTAPGRGREGME